MPWHVSLRGQAVTELHGELQLTELTICACTCSPCLLERCSVERQPWAVLPATSAGPHGGCRTGKRFDELPLWFPDGIVFGLVNHDSRQVKMNPPPEAIVEPGDDILVIRPTCLPDGPYRPAEQPVPHGIGVSPLETCTGRSPGAVHAA